MFLHRRSQKHQLTIINQQSKIMKGVERERLQEYIDKLEKQTHIYKDLIVKLEGQFMAQAQGLIQDHFKKLQLHLHKHKKPLQQQLLTLKFHQQNPNQKGNLFALFNSIDEKIYFNSNIVQSTSLRISLPHPSIFSIEEDVSAHKITIYETYIDKLLGIMKSQNIRKFCKKEAQSCDKLTSIYQALLSNTKESLYCTNLKIKKPIQQALSELPQYRHVQQLSLSMTSQKGIFSNQHYHQVLNSLFNNRFFLKKLDLKIMDMEFTQEKSDILRKRIPNQFPNLKMVLIQNYYKECKLGMFEDFNWHPFRKKVHINANVW